MKRIGFIDGRRISLDRNVVTGIQLGSLADPMVTPTTGLSYIKIWTKPTIDDGEYHVPIWVIAELGLTGGGSIYGIRGHANIDAGITMDSTGYLVGLHGRIANEGIVNNAGVIMAGVMGQVLAGVGYTTASHVAAGWFDIQADLSGLTGLSEILYLSHNGQNAINSIIYIWCSSGAENLLDIGAMGGGFLDWSAHGNTEGGRLRVLTTSGVRYLYMYEN